ncbi:MAG: DUF6798 domain-containing protein, partial [Actinomycetota bacterium]|nr:DUF6798 domain-containing protein [Actinomycetota bacterium]
AFHNDWFNERAPQPHWFYDIVTYIGDKSGHLPGVYFAYFLVTLAVFGVGISFLASYWLPKSRRPLAIGAALLAAAGPKFVFGQFLPLGSEALPNLLGGALAFAAAAAIVSRRHRAAVVFALSAGLVHVQHGTVVAGILFLVAILSRDPKAIRLWYAGTAGALLLLTGIVSSTRGLVADNKDMIEICENASPGHCNANVWIWPVVRDGIIILLLAAAITVLRRREWRVLVPVLAIPAAISIVGFLADRHDVAFFGELAQRVFPYRVNSVVVPFAPWLAVLLVGAPVSKLWHALVRAAGAIWVSGFYLSAPNSITAAAIVEYSHLRQLGWIVGALLATPMLVDAASKYIASVPIRKVATSWAVSAVLAVVACVGVINLGFSRVEPGPLHMGIRPGDGQYAFGQAIGDALPVDAVLAHPPDLTFIRLFTRRAVVGNCRAIPYGGDPWTEYKERMAALGAPGPYYACYRSGYEALTADDVYTLRDRYGATHILLMGVTDPKIAFAEAENWDLVWTSGPGAEPWWVYEIPPR